MTAHDVTAEVSAVLVTETESAFLINDGSKPDGEGVWVPKSLTTHDERGTFTMPEWLAKQRGLI